MTHIGVKDLKDHLSEYLRRVDEGERIIVTDRGQPVAVLLPIEEAKEMRWAWDLVREGKATWGGGKPRGYADAPNPRGRTAAATVLEDRR